MSAVSISASDSVDSIPVNGHCKGPSVSAATGDNPSPGDMILQSSNFNGGSQQQTIRSSMVTSEAPEKAATPEESVEEQYIFRDYGPNEPPAWTQSSVPLKSALSQKQRRFSAADSLAPTSDLFKVHRQVSFAYSDGLSELQLSASKTDARNKKRFSELSSMEEMYGDQGGEAREYFWIRVRETKNALAKRSEEYEQGLFTAETWFDGNSRQ